MALAFADPGSIASTQIVILYSHSLLRVIKVKRTENADRVLSLRNKLKGVGSKNGQLYLYKNITLNSQM